MALPKYFIALSMCLVALNSCSEKSLQSYLVEKQDDDKFVKMDLATSMLQGINSNFTSEEKEVLETIKKINVVAFPIKEQDAASYAIEKKKLTEILQQEQYKELTRFKSNNWNATLKYTGKEDAINEVIVFVSDDTRGFAVFRLLGKNMRPDQLLQFLQSAEKGGLDLSKLSGLNDVFKD